MSKNINHLQHIKSSVVEEGKPKLPTSGVLAEGEIAVNYADGYETLSIKTSSGNIATFSSDKYYTETKLGSFFSGENSAKTVTDVIEENEEITSAALNYLNEDKVSYDEFDILSDSVANKVNVSTFTAYTASTNTVIQGKQDTLVSGTNIKTVNDESLLGSGNIVIQGGGEENIISAITFNNDAVPVTNKVANITATIPTSLSQLSDDTNHRLVSDSNISTWNGKQDEITDLSSIRTSASTQSDWNAVSGISQILNKPTIPEGLPQVTSSDNGKILMVVDGVWTLVDVTVIYSGANAPDASQGKNGDIYIQIQE